MALLPASKLEALKTCKIKEFAKENRTPGESSSFSRVMKSASLKTEILKKSAAEVIEEPHSLRELPSSDQPLSN
jgi:hypothetical protein